MTGLRNSLTDGEAQDNWHMANAATGIIVDTVGAMSAEARVVPRMSVAKTSVINLTARFVGTQTGTLGHLRASTYFADFGGNR